MEIIRILSLAFLVLIDLCMIFCYIVANNDNDKDGRNIVLVLLTMFMLPTIYIVLN